MENNNYIYIESLEYASELVSRTMKEVLRKYYKFLNFEVSHQEHIIMEIVHFNPGIIQMDIAKKISMQRGYVSKLLTKLENSGYIKKEEGIRGKQQIVFRCFLTNEGERIYQKISQTTNLEIQKRITKENFKDTKETAQKLFRMVEMIKEAAKLKF